MSRQHLGSRPRQIPVQLLGQGVVSQIVPIRPRHCSNGGITWRALPTDGVWGQVFNSVGFFIGQRRAAIRCVSGVCRQFPAFEGASFMRLGYRFRGPAAARGPARR